MLPHLILIITQEVSIIAQFFLNIFIEVKLLYNGVLVSAL